MGNLVNRGHKVKELFSCKLCDFESEHGMELKTPNDKIVMTLEPELDNNRTRDFPVSSVICVCMGLTRQKLWMSRASNKTRWFHICGKCEYPAEDKAYGAAA